jgi:nucleoside-diphosphate-sugar epimerase
LFAASEGSQKVPTVLVTGATGKVGRHVIPALQRLGFRVRGQYSREPGADPGVDWRRMNFLESLDFVPLVESCDAVVHLAAEITDVSRMERVNVEATRALLAAAQSRGLRYFGHASSMVVYGSPRRRIVDETTSLVDPAAPMVRQYHAEPFMLEYARTKALAELAIRALRPGIAVDIYRPTVVADFGRMLEAGGWSFARKFAAAYRRTQYIYAPDAGAAIAHLVARGLSPDPNRSRIEAFNVCDEDCGTFRDLLRSAYRITGDPRYRVAVDLPLILDLAKDFVKYRTPALRYPLGALRFSNAKLLATGFKFPTGIRSALRQALEHGPERATRPGDPGGG